MKTILFSLICFFATLFTSLNAQTQLSEKQQKIATSIADYFQLDRENIHLHLNKTSYSINEQIWLKGYVREKKNRPTHHTTNIYLNLLNDQGQKIASQLYFAENGIFDGYFSIPKTISSGDYYIQAYTNYMNNFSEDESAVFRITLLNPADNNFGIMKKINYDTLNIQFYPESGVFLEGVTNTIGLHITDCSGLGIQLENIEVVDAKGNIISNTSTDQFGFGRFDIYNASHQNYRIRFKANNKLTESNLPLPAATGMTFSVNNYIYPDKVAVKIKTNPATAKNFTNSIFTLAIQQNDAISFIETVLSTATLEQNIMIPRNEISAGFNTIYLIDSNLKLLAQRVIYDPIANPVKSAITINQKNMDSIKLTGTSAIKMGTLSISVLPSATISQNPHKPIQGSLVFDNYLLQSIENLNYYFDNFNRKKHFELDHVLITSKSKYEWDKMMFSAPEKKYESDFGLSIKGSLNSENRGVIHKINMKSSSLGFDEFQSLDSKNEFIFKSLLALDSAKIYFLPKDKIGKILPHRFGFQITDNNRRFNKPFVSILKNCTTTIQYENTLSFPKIEKSILLDSINVVAKNNLKYRNRMGNTSSRSFKITDKDAHKTLLSFIAANGFMVSKVDGSVAISSSISSHTEQLRTIVNTRNETLRTTSNGPSQTIRTTTRTTERNPIRNSPVIFIDDIMVPNHDILDDYNMSRIDEIYMNRHSNDLSVIGSSGTIKIYTKRVFTSSPTDSPSIVVKNGFQKPSVFHNPKYANVRDEGFQKLGTIHWNPIVETDENGGFSFAIPNLYQNSVRIIIEGLDADGNMISESHLLEIK